MYRPWTSKRKHGFVYKNRNTIRVDVCWNRNSKNDECILKSIRRVAILLEPKNNLFISSAKSKRWSEKIPPEHGLNHEHHNNDRPGFQLENHTIGGTDNMRRYCADREVSDD
jgi:hypothetical protein